MRCYAYKSKGKEETLQKHITGIIECLRKAWETEGIKSKLMRIHGVSEPVTNDMLLLAGIMHDIGKAKKELQDTCSEECTSFRHHYVTSALLALKLGYEVEELKLSPDNLEERLTRVLNNEMLSLDLRDAYGDTYLLIVVLPVLLHHYAQVIRELSVLEGLNDAKPFMQIHKYCVSEIASLIDEVRPFLKSEIGLKILSRLKDIITKEGAVELGVIDGGFLQKVSSSYEYVPGRIIVEAFTGLLNMCDGRVASMNR